ncbi:MAG: phenylalanine--tRNA ligase subunit beta [Rhodospirillales bacterium 20-60-12]|nr:MAG: phenylalanine--tRNA ligase subunit beta [Rhodospirillales bacterium 20-60-12]
MKFSLSWLRTHLDTTATLDQITDTLTMIGLEVEAVENQADALAPFKIAHIIEATAHPNADRLRVCRVDTGAGEVSVVCGAPNARTGMKAVFAPPGAFIPGSNITLKIGEIRGIQSAGMLLSAREMGLGDEHDGIVDLPADAPIGLAYGDYAGLNDPIIEVGLTPNRGDAFAVRGIARDLAAAGLGTLRPFTPAPIAGQGASAIVWQNDFPAACPWILGRTVRGVANGPSPDWLQKRLLSIGLRPINILADITNFFTIDLGRPLHVFDADKVAGSLLRLRHGEGETFRGLHGKDVTASAEDCVIADANGAQSLAGIVGGEATSCDETTTNVFIECALFDPVRIALSGQRHAIHSDARQRFERGIDPALLPAALDAATAMIIDLCGGTASQTTEAGAEPAWQRTATMRLDQLSAFGGVDIEPATAIDRLTRLGFTQAAQTEHSITVNVPSWRNDVAAPFSLDQYPDLDPARATQAAQAAAIIEPERDLIEEILRLGGMDAIPAVSLPVNHLIPAVSLTAKQARIALARRTLAARGLAECVTFSFLDTATATLFAATPESPRVANPIAADLDHMRPTSIATLALIAGRNIARGLPDIAVFEIGPSWPNAAQSLTAAGLRAGSTPLSWLAPARVTDALDAKADALATLAALGVPLEALSFTPDAPAYYHPGQSGLIRQGPKTILASFGTLHPRITTALDLPAETIAFEINLDAVAEPKRRRKSAPDLPSLQPLRRDFAFLVDAATPAETLLRAARGAERQLITNVTLFDRYEGDKIPAGQTSLAIAVTLQPREKTLTDPEIEAISQKIIAAITKATNGTLRR